MPAEEVNDGDEYPDGNNNDDDDDNSNDDSSGEEQSQEDNDTLGYAELTPDELKAAFRWKSFRDLNIKFCSIYYNFVRIFDEIGDGFISVEKFKFILKEIDEDFTDEELEEVILEVNKNWRSYVLAPSGAQGMQY